MINKEKTESFLQLAEMTFISTRPEGKSLEMGRYLASFGATMLELPMIATSPIELSEKECLALSGLEKFNWIVFTSQNGVSHFLHHLKKINGVLKLPETTKIAAIGEKTAEELNRAGWPAHFINRKKTSKGLAESLSSHINNTLHVLLPLGNLADNSLENVLNKKAIVTRINVYQTKKPRKINSEIIQNILEDKYQMIICTSPSTFTNLSSCLPAEKRNLRIACIGDITASAIKNQGITPLVIAKNTNSKSIVDAIIDYYKEHVTP